jgi:hypothetical protein
LQQAESIKEKIKAGAESNGAPENKAGGLVRADCQDGEDQWFGLEGG